MTDTGVSCKYASLLVATEQPTLIAAVQLSARAGPSTRSWQLAWMLSTFLPRVGQWHDQARVQQPA